MMMMMMIFYTIPQLFLLVSS